MRSLTPLNGPAVRTKQLSFNQVDLDELLKAQIAARKLDAQERHSNRSHLDIRTKYDNNELLETKTYVV